MNRNSRPSLFFVALAIGSCALVPAEAAQPVNLSTRMLVQTGDYAAIGGFIITGTVPKHVVLRALGPSMTKIGVPNVLRNPALELRNSDGNVIAANNNWRDAQSFVIEASGLAPGNDLEAAIDKTLDPGAYTAIVKSEDGLSGIGLFEVYDLNPSTDSKLANLSTRAVVTPGDNTLIAGFIITGDGTDGIVVRGLGPSLALAGVPGPLMDPVLQLRDSNGTLVGDNDNWETNPGQDNPIFDDLPPPLDSRESELPAILPPGTYTALLNGTNFGSGVGLLELYDRGSIPAATVTRFGTGTFSNIELQYVVLNPPFISTTFRLVFTLPSAINQSGIGSRAALKGVTAPISIDATAAEIQAAIIAIHGWYAYGQFGNPEFIGGDFSHFADLGAVNREPIVTGTPRTGFTIQFGSTVGTPTAYNTWVAGLPLVQVAVP